MTLKQKGNANWKWWVCIGAIALFGLACTSGNDDDDDRGSVADSGTIEYRATIQRTSYGIPHVIADSFSNLGFGQGYAFAQDGICELADQIVKVKSERSLFFGPGTANQNITSDFAYKVLLIEERANANFGKLTQDAQDMIKGYAAGFNRFLAETPKGDLPPACRDAEWVRNISEIDLMMYYLDLVSLTGARNFIDFIGTAGPPGASNSQRTNKSWPDLTNKGLASNGIALGKDTTVSRNNNGRFGDTGLRCSVCRSRSCRIEETKLITLSRVDSVRHISVLLGKSDLVNDRAG